jgi:hypothetical protein
MSEEEWSGIVRLEFEESGLNTAEVFEPPC